MKTLRITLLLFVAAGIVFYLSSCKKTKTSTGTLQVNVQDENSKPILLASVFLVPGGETQLTDTLGNALFSELDENEIYTITVIKANYDTVTKPSIRIIADQTTKTTVMLNSSVGDLLFKIFDEHAFPVSLATVTLNPGGLVQLSDLTGNALFTGISKGGGYSVNVFKAGYDTAIQSGIQVKGGSVTEVTILLSTDPRLHVSDSILDFDSTKTQLPLILSNEGTGSFNWQLVSGSYVWLSVHPISGIVNESETDVLIAEVDRTKLKQGENEAVFYIDAYNAGLKKITVRAYFPKPVFDSTVTDYDGNIYKVIRIGSQYWLDKNLLVTHSPSGSLVTSYYYNSNPDYLATYGRLYTWEVAMNGSIAEKAQGLCPDGWHVPSYSEFDQLISSLGGPALAGGKLKEQGISHWETPNTGATNSSGFTALPGGDYWDDGTYHYLHQRSFFWSSTSYVSSQSYIVYLHNNNAETVFFPVLNSDGFSVRCIKD
ncbi:MAG: FISUMP domain-containing protein [Bacteroidales bacterium]|nr:FISUMP domain-containing protein [Bacteroidales bacterium]